MSRAHYGNVPFFYMHDLKITITRFGLYPADEPVSYVVGFTATHIPTCRSIYRDCTVSFTELPGTHTDDDVLATAWNNLKESVEVWCGACSAKSHVIGSTFVPLLAEPHNEIVESFIDPSIEPVVEPSVESVVEPSVEPVVEPIESVVEPIVEPESEPVIEPSVETVVPIVEPVVEPL